MSLFFRERLSTLFLLSVLATTTWIATSCTLLGECGRDRQYCVGDDCACGPACNGDEDCDNADVCVFYVRTPNHGTCVEPDYADRHGLGPLVENNATTNNSNNSNHANNTTGTNGDTNGGGGETCTFGRECAEGLCCGADDACVSAASDCRGDLSCVDGSVSSNCFGACEADRNCASGWFCDESTSRCAAACSGDADCPGDEECAEDGRCVPPTTTFCSVPGDCDPGEVCGLPLDALELSCISPAGPGPPGAPCPNDVACENLLCIEGECATLCEDSDGCESTLECLPTGVDREAQTVFVDACVESCTDEDVITSASPNHSILDAAALPPDDDLALVAMEVCPGSPDWYSRPELNGTPITGVLRVTAGDGTIDDVNVQVFDQDENVLATGIRNGAQLDFQFVSPTDSTYYYEVGTEAGVVYDLSLRR